MTDSKRKTIISALKLGGIENPDDALIEYLSSIKEREFINAMIVHDVNNNLLSDGQLMIKYNMSEHQIKTLLYKRQDIKIHKKPIGRGFSRRSKRVNSIKKEDLDEII